MALVVHGNHFYHNQSSEFPIGSLIEGIWNQYPDQAKYITRNRFFTDSPLTPLCEGMLKVAGKRASQMSQEEYLKIFHQLSEMRISIEINPPDKKILNFPFSKNIEIYSDDEAMQLAESLASLSKLKIGAVLLDSDGKLISWGWNQHSRNKTLHAEVVLVNHFISIYKNKIPPHCRLISTLQPCAMCAGYLHGYSEDFKSLKIIFKNKDPGPKAQNSILVSGSQLWKNAHS